MLDDKMVMGSFLSEMEKDAAIGAVVGRLAKSTGVLGRRLLGRFGRRAIGATAAKSVKFAPVKTPRTGMKRLLFGKGMGATERLAGTRRAVLSGITTTGLIGGGGIAWGALRQPKPLPPGAMR